MRQAGFLLIVLTACGGSDSTVIDGGQDATNGGDGSTIPDGAPTDGTTTNDGTTTTDAATDVVTTTDGATADAADGGTTTGSPGKVQCGTTICATGQDCCSTIGGDGGFVLTCVSGGGQCPNGVLRTCDEAADCPTTEVCCYEEQNNNLSSGCHADCTGGGGTRFQACSSTPECLSGTCTVHNCTAGGSVETCKGIPNICP